MVAELFIFGIKYENLWLKWMFIVFYYEICGIRFKVYFVNSEHAGPLGCSAVS